MATMHTPPIDLYAETTTVRSRRSASATPARSRTSPRDNGDLDEPAIAAGEHRLEQVLGW